MNPNGSPFSSPPRWSWTPKSNWSCLRRARRPSVWGASARCSRKWSATTKSAPAPIRSRAATVTPANTSTSTNDCSSRTRRMTDATQINVRLLFFGAAREAAGCNAEELTGRAPARAGSVFKEVGARHPALQRFGRSLLVAVNEEYAGLDAPVSAHDEVAIFPPVSGGAPDEARDKSAQDFFELTTEPIDVGRVARRIVPTRAGATVTLDGYVREWTRGRRT